MPGPVCSDSSRPGCSPGLCGHTTFSGSLASVWQSRSGGQLARLPARVPPPVSWGFLAASGGVCKSVPEGIRSPTASKPETTPMELQHPFSTQFFCVAFCPGPVLVQSPSPERPWRAQAGKIRRPESLQPLDHIQLPQRSSQGLHPCTHESSCLFVCFFGGEPTPGRAQDFLLSHH